MAIGLLFTRESPRWLARAGQTERALENLAFLRRGHVTDQDIQDEFAEIEATVLEEKESRSGLTLKEAIFGPGNFIRFVIAFVIFTLQQFSGQNSVGYYAPQIFASIGYTGTSPSLLASGVYGIVKVIATAIFVLFFVETLGRRISLLTSGLGMGTLFFIVGALLKTHPPTGGDTVPAASKAMAAMLYIYCVFYSFGWGPTPWIYVSDIFPNRTRHYGLSVAAATQWLFNFVISKITLTMVNRLGYKLFFTFGTINIAGMAVFAYFLPETKGRSLEEMDIIFGAIRAEDRSADIKKAQNALHHENLSDERHSDEKDSAEHEDLSRSRV
jgi:sugar porter (SP) family MFS transporter